MKMKKIIEFLNDVKLEMKKVTWPTKKETFRFTLVVILMSVVLALFLGLLDFGFVKFLNKLLF